VSPTTDLPAETLRQRDVLLPALHAELSQYLKVLANTPSMAFAADLGRGRGSGIRAHSKYQSHVEAPREGKKTTPPRLHLGSQRGSAMPGRKRATRRKRSVTVQSPLDAALSILEKSPVSRELVRYLHGRQGFKAHFDDIAVDTLGARPATAIRDRKTVRKRVNRAAKMLDTGGSPVRIAVLKYTATLVFSGTTLPETR
jgi:hypothetical protein